MEAKKERKKLLLILWYFVSQSESKFKINIHSVKFQENKS